MPLMIWALTASTLATWRAADQALVVGVHGVAHAAFLQAEAALSALEAAALHVLDQGVDGVVYALEHGGQAVVQGGGVLVEVAEVVLVAVHADEEHGAGVASAGVLVGWRSC